MKKVTPKRRFEVLERDWFTCKYCWRKAPQVQLEVDHIIPTSKWWTNTLDNLVTSCFECNRWKWWNTKTESKKNLYKRKINDVVIHLKNHFYNTWNNNLMWSIDEKTKTLLALFINDMVKWDNNLWYSQFLDFAVKDEIPYNEINFQELNIKFLLWWMFCDKVLSFLKEECENDINLIFEEIMEEENWKKSIYNERLNFKLTQYWDREFYIIKKYTLFPNAYKNECD